ncbi:MAG: oligosaccharide flippase family protein, partial [Hyphomicrobiales bacterium]|nr:oligosaccharide flippase family protein [Hyphomicrobiales bacterium]
MPGWARSTLATSQTPPGAPASSQTLADQPLATRGRRSLHDRHRRPPISAAHATASPFDLSRRPPRKGAVMGLRAQATSLAVLHAADVIQPLILLPYAARVLGPPHFGEYAYALSIGQITGTLVDYGFHWTAQREAAAARHEPERISEILAEVYITKTLLALLVTTLVFVAADSVITVSKPILLTVVVTSAGSILFPAWLFVAIERAWQATVGVVVARLLALIAFVAVVKSPADLSLAVATQAGIPLISGVATLPFVIAFGLGGFRTVTPSRIAMQLRAGWRGFLFTFVDRALTTLPVPLVEHFGGFAVAGQYSIAEKFVSATRPFFRMMSETFLPRVAYYAKHD